MAMKNPTPRATPRIDTTVCRLRFPRWARAMSQTSITASTIAQAHRVALGQVGGRIEDQGFVALQACADLHAVVAVHAGGDGNAVGRSVDDRPDGAGLQRL